jgi:hypothetical protein
MSYQDEEERGAGTIPASSKRVPLSTSPHLNRRIRRQMEIVLSHYAARLDEIGRRLDELDEEWDTERTLEANASALALTGCVLGATVSRRWFLLPAVVSAFLLQHALEGWCPPLPVLRHLGFRTRAEIDEERYALKALRGDFAGLENGDKSKGEKKLDAAARAERALEAVRA